jgi:hypothetical protein
MSEPLLKVPLAELRACGVSLRADEAVALVLQLGERLNWQAAPPPAHAIVLQSDGRIDVRAAAGEIGATAASYARLLHELLPEPHAAVGGKVPGGLRLLVARALGDGGLPIVTPEAFATALARFAPASTADALVGVLVRWAESTSHVTVVRRPERRRSGPSVSDLRQQLRQSDLQRYALLSRLSQLESTDRLDLESLDQQEDEKTVRVAIAIDEERADVGAPDSPSPVLPMPAVSTPARPPADTSSVTAVTARSPEPAVVTTGASSSGNLPFTIPAYQIAATRRLTRVAAVPLLAILIGFAVEAPRLLAPEPLPSVPPVSAVPIRPPSLPPPVVPEYSSAVPGQSNQPVTTRLTPVKQTRTARAGKEQRKRRSPTRSKFLGWVKRLFLA